MATPLARPGGRPMALEAMWVLLTRMVNRGSNFLVFLLLARALTQAEFGLYGYIVSTTLVLAVALDLGLRQSAAFLVGREPLREAAIATHLLAAWLVLGTVAGGIAWAALVWGGHAETGPGAGLLVAGATAAMLWIRMGQGVFLGQGRIRNLNQSELVSRVVMLGGTVGLWLVHRLTLPTALWLLLLAHLVAGGWLLFQIRALIRLRLLGDWPLVSSMARRGLAFASGIVLMSLMGRVGIWVVDARLDANALGAYFGVLRVAEMIVEVATAVGVVIFSHGVRAADPVAAAAEAARVNRAALLVMALAALVVGTVAGPFLGVLLGPAYADETLAFRLILAGAVPSCLTMMLFPSLTAQGHARWGALVFGPGVVANAGLTWILAPIWGVPGAAAAAALANLLVATILCLIYRRQFGLKIVRLLFIQPDDLRAALRLGRSLVR